MQRLSKQPAFDLGQIVATPGALAALKKAGQGVLVQSHGGLPHFYNAKGAGTLVRLSARFVIGLTLVLHRYLCVLVEQRLVPAPVRRCRHRFENISIAQSMRSFASHSCRSKRTA